MPICVFVWLNVYLCIGLSIYMYVIKINICLFPFQEY